VNGRAAGYRALLLTGIGTCLLTTWVVLAVQVPIPADSEGWYTAAAMAPCLAVSTLLVARLPGAAITRLVTTITVCQLILLTQEAIGRWQADRAGTAYDHAAVTGPAWFGLVWLGTVPLLPLLLAVFPDGVPGHGFWRRVWVAQIIALALLTGVAGLQLAGGSQSRWLAPAIAAGAILVVSGILRGGWLVNLWRRAHGERRAQLLPFVAVAAGLAAVYIAAALQQVFTGRNAVFEGVLGAVIGVAILAGLPLALGLSVLRHRLFGIEVTINRVAVATAVAVMLFGVYTATVAAVAAVTGRGEGASRWDWGQLLAAGIAVAALGPLYRLARAGIDRLMFGDRDRPDRALRHLAGRLGETVDPLEVPDVVVNAVADTLRLPFVALDRDTDTGTARAAARGWAPPERVTDFPITYAGQRLGVLQVACRTGEARLTAPDRALLDDLAAQAGPALYSGRLAHELADSRERLRLGRLEERARLRRALHDGLSPALSGIAIAAAAARGREPASADVERLLSRIQDEAATSALNLRALIAGLRPPDLSELGLAAGIESRAAELAAASGVAFDVHTDAGLPALDPDAEQTAYLVTVEAMVNVVRHARAAHCRVDLTGHGNALGVQVTDDGRGIPPGTHTGDGLSSARERVDACGGTLGLATQPDGGTLLELRLPAWTGA
jgi:two-component system NarL family sensor kinase